MGYDIAAIRQVVSRELFAAVHLIALVLSPQHRRILGAAIQHAAHATDAGRRSRAHLEIVLVAILVGARDGDAFESAEIHGGDRRAVLCIVTRATAAVVVLSAILEEFTWYAWVRRVR